MVPVVPVITGITFISTFTFHIHCVYTVRPLYFKIFSAFSLNTFLSHKIGMSINRHVPLSLIWIMMSALLFCKFSPVDSIIQLPYFYDFFLLMLVLAHTGVPCLILPSIYLHMVK